MGIMHLMRSWPPVDDLSDESREKVLPWTVAQLVAWLDLVDRSGEEPEALMERTMGGVMPGIGGAMVGDVGTLGVTNFHGMFVGIEPDGYVHS